LRAWDRNTDPRELAGRHLEDEKRRVQNNRRQLREEPRTKKGRKMKDKDREIWIGENRLYLGEDSIIYITVIGEQNGEIAIAFKETLLKFVNMAGGRTSVLVDLNKGGKTSPEARKIWSELTTREEFSKTALFGLHPVAKVLASFVMGVTRKKDMRFFESREKALAWLKQ